MDTQIIATYCLCDDLMKLMDQRADPQSQMTGAAVLTPAIAAALFFAAILKPRGMRCKNKVTSRRC